MQRNPQRCPWALPNEAIVPDRVISNNNWTASSSISVTRSREATYEFQVNLPNSRYAIDCLLYCTNIQHFVMVDALSFRHHKKNVHEGPMAGERKQVTIHYRKLDRNGGFPAGTLEQHVRAAMEANVDGHRVRDRFRTRVRALGEDNYFVNTFYDRAADETPLVFGDVIHFTKGHLQALFTVAQTDVAVAPVQQMPAPSLTEYVHSEMFWMIKGDHVFVIQSMSLRTEELESYLAWLLSELTATLPQPAPQIVLAARFDEQLVGGDLNDIQEIVVGGVAAPAHRAEESDTPPAPQEREITQHGEVGTARTTGWAQAWDILKTLLGGDANVDKVMQSVPPDADLRVEVHIGYKTRKRSVSRAGLRQLETGLRNLPDSQLQVKARGMSKSSDGSVRLHHNASVQLIKAGVGDNVKVGSLLDPTDVLRAMYEAYNVMYNNGKISDDPGT
ncbi:hypothetical protein [Burkholderia multivorans]|uniref:hypothetical protein n=1 Tax=Burkholderia TaxID=32008 RepID=UPI0011323E70|nr:hypothetical protein [Burkholderia multivorans]HEF4771931.1 hypothetical protein [Burkholderia multivorans]